MIARPGVLAALRRALRTSPVVALVGPRQSGKTTLARSLQAPSAPGYFDLEDPTALARLQEPKLALGGLRGTVVIDEVQRRPELFPLLRVLVDRRPRPARFLVLGSASPVLLRQSSESLAGRIQTIELKGFSVAEVGAGQLARLWRRGGFPLSFTARSERESVQWRGRFLQSVIERDLPELGVTIPGPAFRRFWGMLAHYHGQIWDASEPARSLGVSPPTVRRYLDLLTGLFMVRQLPPWHENIGKRQIKSPKIYLRDSGLLHVLLGIPGASELDSHPKVGASWEGFALEQIIAHADADEAYFWATLQGAELDLLLIRGGRRIGVEFKRADAPRITNSMRIAIDDLKLERLWVVYPGPARYALSDRITVAPLADLLARPARELWRRR